VLRPRRLRQDAGFTLVELLVAIVVLGIIAVPLGNVVLSYLTDSGAVSGRLSESHSSQIAAAYFAQDVQAVGVRDYTATGTATYPLLQSLETAAPATGGRYPCGTAGTPDALVRLAWDDFPGAPGSPATQDRAAYVVEGSTLHRLACTGSTLVVDLIVARDLTATAPVVGCANAAGTAVACTGSGAAVPATVTLTFSVHSAASAAGGSYSVSLTGTRRQSQ
jgi:prepilin-type N-terminal cleavage/methylation domain-containing protein